jgi:transposase
MLGGPWPWTREPIHSAKSGPPVQILVATTAIAHASPSRSTRETPVAPSARTAQPYAERRPKIVLDGDTRLPSDRSLLDGHPNGTSDQVYRRKEPSHIRGTFPGLSRVLRNRRSEVRILSGASLPRGDSDPIIAEAWGLKEAFRDVYRAGDRADAQRRLELFLAAVERAGLPAFDAFAKGVRLWHIELLAYFDEPTTNGYAEGASQPSSTAGKRVGAGFGPPPNLHREQP